MIFKWPNNKERILEYMRIPPKKKMEWLYEMSRFMRKISITKKREPAKTQIIQSR